MIITIAIALGAALLGFLIGRTTGESIGERTALMMIDWDLGDQHVQRRHKQGDLHKTESVHEYLVEMFPDTMETID